MKMTARRIAGICLIVVGLLLLGYGIQLALTPSIFLSTVRMKVEKDPPLPYGDFIGFDPYWVQTEFEKIASKMILYPVITNLQLKIKWAERDKERSPLSVERTYSLLKEKLDVRQTRGTSLIEISVKSEDRAEAAAIANAIAEEYRRTRISLRDEGRGHVLDKLKNVEQQIENLEMQLTRGNTNSADTNKLSRDLADFRDSAKRLRFDLAQDWDPKNFKALVEIIDPAEPALRPIYPNIVLIWGALLSGLILTFWGVRLCWFGGTS